MLQKYTTWKNSKSIEEFVSFFPLRNGQVLTIPSPEMVRHRFRELPFYPSIIKYLLSDSQRILQMRQGQLSKPILINYQAC